MNANDAGPRLSGARSDPAPSRYRKPGFWRRLRDGNPSEAQLAGLLLAPALLTLALVMLYPVLSVLWQSLHLERLNQPQRGTPFVGLDNFARMLWVRGDMAWSASKLWVWRALLLTSLLPLWRAAGRGLLKRRQALLWTVLLLLIAGWLLGLHPAEGSRWGDPRFWNSFQITLLLILISVVGAFLLGMPLALLANIEHPLKWLVRLALLLPWAMPRVFSGLAFAWLLQSDYGVINDLMGRLGLNEVLRLLLPDQWIGSRGVFWLARDVPAVVAVSAAIIWKTASFVGLILLAGLQSVDGSLYEAARIDGANAWQRFWRVTLPLLRPAIMVALIFRTLTAVQTFDEPFAMTGGGPGRTLETLGIYVYKTVNALDIGYAAALAVALFAISLFITVFYLRWVYRDD